MSTQTSDPFATPAHASSLPPGPPPGAPSRPPSGAPPSGAEPPPPWWQRDGVVSRILVLAGVAVTLVGVVMLLVVAAQNGLLGPQVRVAGGAALSAALVLTGWRVMDRPGGRIGGIALQATGFAGLYLDLLAVTTFYEWVAPGIGLAGAMAIAVAGVATAMRWQTQSLAVIVNVCCAVLAPALTRGLDLPLVSFLLVFAVVGAVPEIRLGWSVLAPVRTLPVVLAATLAVAIAGVGGEPWSPPDLLVPAAVVAVGITTGLMALHRRPRDVLALVAMALTALPALAVGERLETWAAVAWYCGLAVVFLAPAVLDRGLPRPVTGTLAAVAGVSLLAATTVLSVGYDSALPFFLLALAVLAADLTSRVPLVHLFGQLTLLVAAVILLGEVGARHLVEATSAPGLTPATGLTAWVAVVVAVVAGVGALGLRGPCAELRPLLVGGNLVLALYAVTAGFVTVGVRMVSGPDGFSLGQGLATAVWMAAAFGLLTFGLRRPEHARYALTGGLALVAAALSKLFLFDLAALSGLSRAAAFLVVGLLLLAAGTRYARAFAERTGGVA